MSELKVEFCNNAGWLTDLRSTMVHTGPLSTTAHRVSYVRGRGSHRGDFSQIETVDTQYDDYVKIISLSSNHVVLFLHMSPVIAEDGRA